MTLQWRVLDATPVRSLADHERIGGGEALRIARNMSARGIIDTVTAAGLRGRGGAGFPTGTKIRTVAESRSDQIPTTVVVNAAEGEPGTFKDRALLRTNPYRILEGAVIAALAVGAPAIKIGIKASFEREVQRLEQSIQEITAAGWLDGLTVDVVRGPSAYLFGEETGMLEVLEGRQPFPRVTPPFRRGLEDADTRSAGGVDLATAGGSDEPPALVDNVETLANLALILANGVGWFRELGTERSPGTIVCTVSGATLRDGVGEVAMGTTLREAIELIGWGVGPNRDIGLVISGTANALIPRALLDTPLTYEAMRDAGSGLGSAGFIVFDDEADPVAVAQGISRFLAVESCGQCEPCKRDGAALSTLLGNLAGSDLTDLQMTDLRSRVETVTIGARCNLALQQADVVGSLLDLFGDSVNRHLKGTGPGADPVVIVPIANLSGGRSLLDLDQLDKQPDWSTDRIDSGIAPAARLGDTPVHIDLGPSPQRRWPEWRASVVDEHPLEILDDAHDLLDRLLHEAFHAPASDRNRHLGKLGYIIRLHVDVTRRILYPMARRYGGEDGESAADAADEQGPMLLSALDRLEHADADAWSGSISDLGSALRDHADREDTLVTVLRTTMDPAEREVLADGLAEARMTNVSGAETRQR